MKHLLFLTIAACTALVPALANARGGGGHSGGAHSGGSHSSSSGSYHPAKTYSCPGCNSNDHYVAPNVRSNGQHVQGHMRTGRNQTRTDNFTKTGNVNPYTGEPGNKN